MKLALDEKIATGYKSSSQKARVLTERWVDNFVFCPSCGHVELEKYQHNKPVGDFYCNNCHEDYELKSKKSAKIASMNLPACDAAFFGKNFCMRRRGWS